MTVEIAAKILGIQGRAVYARIYKGKLKATRVQGRGPNYTQWEIPEEEVERALNIDALKSDAWDVIMDLREDGIGFAEIGRLVNPKAKHPYQLGNMAFHYGVISDPEGFFERLEKEGL